MEEIENFAENIHEQSNEHAHHLLHGEKGHEHEHKDKWVLYVALTTAVIAVLAAITGLLAGDHADEAMIAQIKSSDSWAFYQAKGIKSDVLASTNNLLVAMGKPVNEKDAEKVKENKTEQAKIMKEATDFAKESKMHTEKHRVLARGVTLFQIAIAIGAISIITKRKILWMGSVGFALIAVYFLLQGTVF